MYCLTVNVLSMVAIISMLQYFSGAQTDITTEPADTTTVPSLTITPTQTDGPISPITTTTPASTSNGPVSPITATIPAVTTNSPRLPINGTNATATLLPKTTPRPSSVSTNGPTLPITTSRPPLVTTTRPVMPIAALLSQAPASVQRFLQYLG